MLQIEGMLIAKLTNRIVFAVKFIEPMECLTTLTISTKYREEINRIKLRSVERQ